MIKCLEKFECAYNRTESSHLLSSVHLAGIFFFVVGYALVRMHVVKVPVSKCEGLSKNQSDVHIASLNYGHRFSFY